MIHTLRGASLADPRALAMFEDRKRLFVDLLGWDVAVTGDRYEVDAYDHAAAIYLIATDTDGAHAGSMRLLPTCAPHLLDDLFAALCDGDIPRGADVMEITRLCLPARLGAAGRLAVRNRLISAMVDHALESGIHGFTGVVTAAFRAQVLAMGWRASPLGEARTIGGAMLGAFHIDVDADTPRLLAARGIYAPRTRGCEPPDSIVRGARRPVPAAAALAA